MSKNMGKYSPSLEILKFRQGAVAIIVGLMMVVFIGLAALAIDIGHLYVVRNELKNAADAGALAGARFLYNDDGTVNTGANQIAHDTAISNTSEKVLVEVNWIAGNDGDVQRGHWCFSCIDPVTGETGTFEPNDSIAPVKLWDITTEELDRDVDNAGNKLNFINAVRVVTRRQATPAASFFARIFGRDSFILEAHAVAYVGYTGSMEPFEADQPIVICKQGLLDDSGRYYCRARMINSGPNITSESAAWSNFDQEEGVCNGAASNNEVQPLVCSGNPGKIYYDKYVTTNNGELQKSFNDFIACWKGMSIDLDGDETNGAEQPLDRDGDGYPDLIWNQILPVIDCEDGISPCNLITGSVTVSIVWITGSGESFNNNYKNVPKKMEGWTCPTGYTNEECWNGRPGETDDNKQGFTQYFEINDETGAPYPYMQKTIYYKPDCAYHEPAGETGGKNFGMIAKIPKLVD